MTAERVRKRGGILGDFAKTSQTGGSMLFTGQVHHGQVPGHMTRSAEETQAAAFEDHLRKCNKDCCSFPLHTCPQTSQPGRRFRPRDNFGGVIPSRTLIDDMDRRLWFAGYLGNNFVLTV